MVRIAPAPGILSVKENHVAHTQELLEEAIGVIQQAVSSLSEKEIRWI
jgi:hypothetical protein